MNGTEILIPLGVLATFVLVVALGVFIIVRLRSGDALSSLSVLFCWPTSTS